MLQRFIPSLSSNDFAIQIPRQNQRVYWIFTKWLYKFDKIDELLWYAQLYIAAIFALRIKDIVTQTIFKFQLQVF